MAPQRDPGRITREELPTSSGDARSLWRATASATLTYQLDLSIKLAAIRAV
jgi:hypothetical protein